MRHEIRAIESEDPARTARHSAFIVSPAGAGPLKVGDGYVRRRRFPNGTSHCHQRWSRGARCVSYVPISV